MTERIAKLDFIGDTHGAYGHLTRLLERLGYRRGDDWGWSHPGGRRVVFLGDYVDRGDEIREVLETVRAMVESGDAYAIAGNHEFNFIAWHTFRSEGSTKRCRPEHKRSQLQKSLDQLGEAAGEWVEWMRQLPPWWACGNLRAIHACWVESEALELMELWRDAGGWSEDLVRRASDSSNREFHLVERVMKGVELRLPPGVTITTGAERTVRHRARIAWWSAPEEERPMGDQLVPPLAVPTPPLGESAAAWPNPDELGDRLVFCGHYWLTDERPRLRSPQVACLDYSVAQGGKLCAYRHDGERELSEQKMVWV